MPASVLTQQGREGRKLVPCMDLDIRARQRRAWGHGGEDWLRMYLRRVIALEPGNRIKCRGALPTFSPPPPYSDHHEHFQNNQMLCATELDFGSRADKRQPMFFRVANAGGYCHRSEQDPALDDQSKFIWFSDPLTPRFDWKWGGGNFFFSAAIRYHCWKNCRCADYEPGKGRVNNPTSKVWQFVRQPEVDMIQKDDGSIVLGSALAGFGQAGSLNNSDQGPSRQQLQILPPQSGPMPPSGTCGADSRQFCPSAWPSDILGPIPQGPPKVETQAQAQPDPAPTSLFPGLPKPPKCGNSCTGQKDCNITGDGNTGCNCQEVQPGAKEVRLYGLDPVFPGRVCLPILLTATVKSLLKGQVGSRSLSEVRDCWCNSTYLSSNCCGSADGVV
ncbi:MAG: hypothetical protein Q9164_002177 [Protoblastenia rupestris]